jgi:NhaP-type Na+/H+ or K+/H+ antiporter
MLLWMSTDRRAGRFWEEAERFAGDVLLEAADGLAAGLAVGQAAVQVRLAGWSQESLDRVLRYSAGVGLAVAAAVSPGVSGGGF